MKENVNANSLTRRIAPWRDVLGIPVADFRYDEAIAFLARRMAEQTYTPVAFLNANNANIAMENIDFHESLDEFLILSDGVGVDIAAWLLHGKIFKANLNGTDFVPALLRHHASKLKVGLIGARREVVDAAVASFTASFPQHEFLVISDGFFKPEDEAFIAQKTAEFHPDIVLVAMGVPRQEQFVTRVLTKNVCTLPIAVGALFDIYTGTVPRAPEWMRSTRSEWVYRLWKEPRRLWRRYIMGNPLFIMRVFRCRLSGASRSGGGPLTATIAKQDR
jgi:exopolysaccharide biosynthesis WecB/TagA/CpsF family protein